MTVYNQVAPIRVPSPYDRRAKVPKCPLSGPGGAIVAIAPPLSLRPSDDALDYVPIRLSRPAAGSLWSTLRRDASRRSAPPEPLYSEGGGVVLPPGTPRRRGGRPRAARRHVGEAY